MMLKIILITAAAAALGGASASAAVVADLDSIAQKLQSENMILKKQLLNLELAQENKELRAKIQTFAYDKVGEALDKAKATVIYKVESDTPCGKSPDGNSEITCGAKAGITLGHYYLFEQKLPSDQDIRDEDQYKEVTIESLLEALGDKEKKENWMAGKATPGGNLVYGIDKNKDGKLSKDEVTHQAIHLGAPGDKVTFFEVNHETPCGDAKCAAPTWGLWKLEAKDDTPIGKTIGGVTIPAIKEALGGEGCVATTETADVNKLLYGPGACGELTQAKVTMKATRMYKLVLTPVQV